eukprot:m.149774 g.149774  ORF g.149774 m.149774 type:complete len:538 (-) comp16303_c0_seq8:1958-3571(-)
MTSFVIDVDAVLTSASGSFSSCDVTLPPLSTPKPGSSLQLESASLMNDGSRRSKPRRHSLPPESVPFVQRHVRSPLATAADRLGLKRSNSQVYSWIQRHPWVLLPICVLIPIGVTLVLYGIVPLGDPKGSFVEKLPKTLVVNPVVYSVYALMMTILFYAVLDSSKPWRRWQAYVPPLVTMLVVQIGADFLLYGLGDTFPLIGLVSFALATLIILVSLRFSHFAVPEVDRKQYMARYKSFRKILIFTAVFVVLLTLWVLGYQQLDQTFRILAPFIFIFVLHFNKRFLLTSGHDYPIELNMLISGLVLENMDDVFQSLVFPLIPESQPFLFFLLVARKFLENVVFLMFFTKTWFAFRVRANDFLKRLATCRLKEAGQAPSFEDLDVDDRGHGFQRPAYLRRQTHWYFMRVLSQTHGYLNYLAMAPVLRFGVNQDYFPLSEGASGECLADEEFNRSMWFGAIALGITWMTAGVGYFAIRRFCASTLIEMESLYQPLITSPVYFGFVMVILLNSSLLAFNVAQFHNRIWFISGLDESCLES